MKIGVMADSHDNVPRIEQAVALFNRRRVELVIHAGDFVSPFALWPFAELRCPLLGVFGNNDGERVGLSRAFDKLGEVHPNLATTELAGRRIAAVHYPELAEPLTAGDVYDLVIYGHTHKVDLRPGPPVLLNPGEAGGWLSGKATVAIVDLPSLEVEIAELA